MDLYLQIGHGMMGHCRHLIEKWGEGTVILSPKNMTKAQILKFSSDIKKLNGSVLIDPQFYIPRSSQHNLHKHSFWPDDFSSTNAFFTGNGLDVFLRTFIEDYVLPAACSALIVPGLLLDDEVNEDWDTINHSIFDSLSKFNLSIPKYMTLCIGSNVFMSEDKTHALLEMVEDYPVEGFYLIPEHPGNDYLVDNVSWLFNVMDFVAGLKIKNKHIIIGYSNHQFLAFALAKADAICAGSWLKTRMFPRGDFDIDEETSFGRKTTWYYCPQALSEYQVPFLDIASRAGILEQFKPSAIFGSQYADNLFTGAQPTTVAFNEALAFRHYLHCLRYQCHDVSKNTYDETKTYLQLLFETASDLSDYFRSHGVRGKYREFSNVADTNLGLLDAFDSMRGLAFKTKWNEF
ncbi:MAG: hypothetical protein WCR47_08460 [Desulfoplanes sp.]